MPQFAYLRTFLAIGILVAGSATLISGAYLEMQNPRNNHEDDLAWAVLAIGASAIGLGTGILLRRTAARTMALAVLFPAFGYGLLIFLVWAYLIGTSLLRLAGFG